MLRIEYVSNNIGTTHCWDVYYSDRRMGSVQCDYNCENFRGQLIVDSDIEIFDDVQRLCESDMIDRMILCQIDATEY